MIVEFKGETSVEAVRILNNLGNVYAQQGDYKKADKRLKTAIKITDQLYMDDDQKESLRAMSLTNLGEVSRLKGNLDKAKRCLEEALEIRENQFGDGHIDVAGNVESLGNVYFDMGDFHRARKNYERALIIKKSKMSKDSPEIAQTLSNIGNLNSLPHPPPPSILTTPSIPTGNTCKNMNELDKAKKYYQDSYNILILKFGEGNHP